MTRVLYLAFALVIAVLGLVLHVRNAVPVSVDFVLGRAELSLSAVMVAALVLGVVLGVLAMSTNLLRLRRENRRLARRAASVEREAASLRALALKDAD